MRLATLFFCALLSPGPAWSGIVDEHVDKMLTLSESGCRVKEQSYRAAYSGSDRRVAGTVSFLAEGTRLVCEALRTQSEIDRLASEQVRLRQEAARLEMSWQRAHSVDPLKFPDSPGRDRSQKRLLTDANIIEGTLQALGNNKSTLLSEAQRILRLSSAEFSQLEPSQADVVLASLDGEDWYDVLKRLLDGGEVVS